MTDQEAYRGNIRGRKKWMKRRTSMMGRDRSRRRKNKTMSFEGRERKRLIVNE